MAFLKQFQTAVELAALKICQQLALFLHFFVIVRPVCRAKHHSLSLCANHFPNDMMVQKHY